MRKADIVVAKNYRTEADLKALETKIKRRPKK
jgi:hypothetical protein